MIYRHKIESKKNSYLFFIEGMYFRSKVKLRQYLETVFSPYVTESLLSKIEDIDAHAARCKLAKLEIPMIKVYELIPSTDPNEV